MSPLPETTIKDRLALFATVASLALAGCAGAPSEEIPETPSDAGDKDKEKNKEKDKDKSDEEEDAPLPPPIHDERDVMVAAGPEAVLDDTGCMDAQPCFDYSFSLARQALLRANVTRGGDAEGIEVDLWAGGTRVAYAATNLYPPGPVASIEKVLDAGAYMLRVQVFRAVDGHFVLDATFHEPPSPPSPDGPDPLFGQQWGLAMSRVPESWSFATGKNVTIAFIDSGIDLDHPDLAGKIDVVEGAAIVGDSVQDADGHGTHVAGIAAASANNGLGIAGVAPDAHIMPVRVLILTGPQNWVDPALYTQHPSDIAQAIRLATDNGADVISMSIASSHVPGDSSATVNPQVDEALDYAWSKGVVMVAAAGNGYAIPQCADIAAHPHVLCVGAVDNTGQRASYSNLEVGSLTGAKDFIVAPGGETYFPSLDCATTMLSTVPHGNGTCAQEIDGAWYAGMAGTSMAAPFVAGVAALLVEQGLSNEEIMQRILDTADPTVGSEDSLPDPNPLYGYGLVNAYCAVSNGAGDGCP